MDKLKEFLDKVPIMVVLVLCLMWLGWDYYTFTSDDASPWIMKQREIEGLKTENEKLQTKVKQANEFLKSLESKKAELRKLAEDLDSMKGTVSETLDVPEFMKTTLTEARRVGLIVVKLQPSAAMSKEFYAEQPFDFSFRGVYVQLMAFLDHMANIQKIVRVDNFSVKPVSSSSSRYVELEGTVQIKAYRYLTSKADSIARDKNDASSKPGATPTTPAKTGGS
jgi:type IV pilus assembly protein PilO